MARKVARAFSGTLRGKTIGVLGLTFKPDTDDMREAPSISLITALQDLGAKVRVYDPAGMAQAREVLDNVTYCDGPYDCAEAADALVIATEWEQFRALELSRLREAMAAPIIIDLRNIYRPDEMEKLGFIYESVGRPSGPRTNRRRGRTTIAKQVPPAEVGLAGPSTIHESDPVKA
jgi:UDPglucose 6-dehydrogenase